MAHLFERRFEEAAAAFLASLQQLPSFAWAYRSLASCYAQMGRLEKARAIIERLRAITPLVMPSNTLFRDPRQHDLYYAGLRAAMGQTQ
jgi:adenylate cyclase